MTPIGALWNSLWRYSPWAWLCLGLLLGMAILGFTVVIAASDDTAHHAQLLLIVWGTWLGWQLVFSQLLARAGMLHHGLAQHLRLPGMAARTVQFTATALLGVCALTACGMIILLPPAHRALGYPLVWALSAAMLWLSALGTAHPQGEKIFLGQVLILALFFWVPFAIGPERTQRLWLQGVEATATPLGDWLWGLVGAWLGVFVLQAYRLQKWGLAGWEARTMMARRLLSPQPPPEPPSSEAISADNPSAALSQLVLPGRDRPTWGEVLQVVVSALLTIWLLTSVADAWSTGPNPMLVFWLSTVMTHGIPLFPPAGLRPRALLLPGGLHREHLADELMRLYLRRARWRSLMVCVTVLAVLTVAGPLVGLELLAILAALLGGHAVAMMIPLAALTWRWPAWSTMLLTTMAGTTLPLLTALPWSGLRVWQPLETPQAWAAWGGLTLATGLLLAAALRVALQRALQRLDAGRWDTASSARAGHPVNTAA